ncbi:DUF2976 domain-containing protein [Vibrio sp. PNB22_3_1]
MKFKKIGLGVALLAGSTTALAAGVPASTINVSNGNYLGMLQSLFNNAYGTGSLLIAAAIFLVCTLAVIASFWNYHKGKNELSDVGVTTAIAGVVMSLVFILLNSGSTVLA